MWDYFNILYGSSGFIYVQGAFYYRKKHTVDGQKGTFGI